MKRRIIGLNFTPDQSFTHMFGKLQKTVSMEFEGVFFLNATKKATKKMKYSAWEGSNKLNGWIIPRDKVTEFEQLFYRKKNLSDWNVYRRSIWAWHDTDVYHEWLFSFDEPIFEETIIE